MPEPPLIAADSNVLLSYAGEEDTVIDCFETLRQRLPASSVLIPPTVLREMAFFADEDPSDEIRDTARAALRRLRHPWNFRPVNSVPVGHGIVERIGQALRNKGLIPAVEINDSFIVAEAGLLDVSILLSSDSHLRDIPHAELRLVMDAADVRTPLIASPWKIVHGFFR